MLLPHLPPTDLIHNIETKQMEFQLKIHKVHFPTRATFFTTRLLTFFRSQFF